MHSHPLKKKNKFEGIGYFSLLRKPLLVHFFVLFWFDNLSEIAPVHNTKKHLIFTKLACSAT